MWSIAPSLDGPFDVVIAVSRILLKSDNWPLSAFL